MADLYEVTATYAAVFNEDIDFRHATDIMVRARDSIWCNYYEFSFDYKWTHSSSLKDGCVRVVSELHGYFDYRDESESFTKECEIVDAFLSHSSTDGGFADSIKEYHYKCQTREVFF